MNVSDVFVSIASAMLEVREIVDLRPYLGLSGICRVCGIPES